MKPIQEQLYESLPESFTTDKAKEVASNLYTNSKKAKKWADMWLKTWLKKGRLIETGDGFEKQTLPDPPASVLKALPDVFNRAHIRAYGQHSVPEGIKPDHWYEHCLDYWEKARKISKGRSTNGKTSGKTAEVFRKTIS